MFKRGYLVYICDKNIEPELRYGVVVGVSQDKLRVKSIIDNEMDAVTVKMRCCKIVFSPPEDEHESCIID